MTTAFQETQRLDDLSPVEETTQALTLRDPAAVAEVVEDDSLPAPSTTHPTSAELELHREHYKGIAQPFNPTVSAVLRKYTTIESDDVELKPDADLQKAQPYLSHTKARDIFNEAFGYGGWAVEPTGEPKIYQDGKKIVIAREFRFYAHGRYIRTVMGAGTYYTSNPTADVSDAYEAAESEAIRRATKAFGIAQNLWNADFRAAWKRQYAVQVRDSRGNLVWMKRSKEIESGAGAASPKAAIPSSSAACVPPVVSKPAPAPVVSPAPGTTTIAPRAFGRLWAQGGYVIDDNDQKWTFKKELLPVAERAINDGLRLKVAYKVKGDYLNVDAAEVIA